YARSTSPRGCADEPCARGVSCGNNVCAKACCNTRTQTPGEQAARVSTCFEGPGSAALGSLAPFGRSATCRNGATKASAPVRVLVGEQPRGHIESDVRQHARQQALPRTREDAEA